jgi:hypothetical protein
VATGTCGERIIWGIGKPAPGIAITATPATGSSVCDPSVPTCPAPGQPSGVTVFVANGLDITHPYVFTLRQYVLSFLTQGTGQGLVLVGPYTLTCPIGCSETFVYGSLLAFTAVPQVGNFVRWLGACAGQGTTCTLTVTSDFGVGVVFDLPGPSAVPTAKAKPGATSGSILTGSPPTSTTPEPSASEVPMTAPPTGEVLSVTAAPSATASAPPADPSGGSDSGSVPWLPIVAIVVVLAVAVNAAIFQVSRARRPRG